MTGVNLVQGIGRDFSHYDAASSIIRHCQSFSRWLLVTSVYAIFVMNSRM